MDLSGVRPSALPKWPAYSAKMTARACSSNEGLAGALAGPISRGDAGVVRRHVADLRARL
ncbi:DUF2520 domain-containing protein [Variovorax rhizosphaerae]|uniref:DUF2520 domain-containing protein n=1 Tax=Variovorax rhizosphaerae TaxID=1836200 RepID=UPI003BF5E8E2